MTTKRAAYNAFTKSYLLRGVVHAARVADELTICGRQIARRSKAPFDQDVEGSCQKCIQKFRIEERIHPGWED